MLSTRADNTVYYLLVPEYGIVSRGFAIAHSLCLSLSLSSIVVCLVSASCPLAFSKYGFTSAVRAEAIVHFVELQTSFSNLFPKLFGTDICKGGMHKAVMMVNYDGGIWSDDYNRLHLPFADTD